MRVDFLLGTTLVALTSEATLPPVVVDLAGSILTSPMRISIGDVNAAAPDVEQPFGHSWHSSSVWFQFSSIWTFPISNPFPSNWPGSCFPALTWAWIGCSAINCPNASQLRMIQGSFCSLPWRTANCSASGNFYRSDADVQNGGCWFAMWNRSSYMSHLLSKAMRYINRAWQVMNCIARCKVPQPKHTQSQ